MSPGAVVFIAVLGLSGLGLVVDGVFRLAGTGWGLVAAGVALMAIAAFLTRGLHG